MSTDYSGDPGPLRFLFTKGQLATSSTTRLVIALTADETALAADLRNGSPAAYERLYRENSARLKSIAANLLGSRTEAEDAVHDAFVKLFRSSANFDGRCPVVCWLIRILVNTCHDRLRQRRPVAPPSEFLRAAPDNPPLRLALQKAIGQLPERQRTVFLLFEVEGLRHAEIAAVMEETENSCRQLLHSARKLLRDLLQPVREQG
jgi:RNA polymerase sigma-70 factor (ECF subfamily)